MNGYYSFKMNGSTIGLKFGLLANRLMWEEMTKNPGMIGADFTNEEGIVHLMLAGYKNNCMVKKIQPILEYGDFLEWVEEAYVDEEKKKILDEIGAVYSESQITKKFVGEKQQFVEDVKKKLAEMNQTGTTSNHSVTES